MACTITITSVLGLVSGGGTVPTSVQVNGTATGCPSGKVKVSIECGDTVSQTVPVSAGGTWTATLPNDHGCKCESTILVTAICTDDSNCVAKVEAPLQCRPIEPQPCHSTGNLTVTVDGCVGAGSTATAAFNLTLAPPIVGCSYEWDFGDGTANVTTAVPNVNHVYLASGAFSVTVTATCPSVTGGTCVVTDTLTVTVPACGGCPKVTDLTATVSGCAGPGPATVTFNGILTPALSGCTFLWGFGDGTPAEITVVPSVSHPYAMPGSYPVSVTASCPGIPICDTTNMIIEVPRCCAVVTDITANVEDEECANGTGKSATMNFSAVTDPSAAAGTYTWDFDDGPTVTNPGPNASHDYSSPGSYTVQVTYTPNAATYPGCMSSTVSKDVTVPACPGPGDGGDTDDGEDDGGEGWGCLGLRIIMTIAAIFALAAAALAACIPAAAPALAWIAAILGLVALIAGIFWAIFCPKPCGWSLLFAWQVAIGAGLILLCFTMCCPVFLIIGLLLIALGITLLLVWKKKCHKSNCEVMKELTIALSGVVLPLLGWFDVIPGLSACLNKVLFSTLTSLAAVVAIWAAKCKS